MRYDFEWDPDKARGNIRKHKVSFERASGVFRDPSLLSVPDEEHSVTEERWITVGLDGSGILLVLSHKFESVSKDASRVRIISARKATNKETEQYEKGI